MGGRIRPCYWWLTFRGCRRVLLVSVSFDVKSTIVVDNGHDHLDLFSDDGRWLALISDKHDYPDLPSEDCQWSKLLA
jgi:hypothetical protein